ncbi:MULTISPECIES: Mce protein [unclassified Mycobacterium]|uniref:Mce protein n=1 Tax=unclassified Mycobacterium TaxID=2642494 RepID=UPI0029C87824|nr:MULTISPECIES: Mce protein [unclassified Mycobacterium]
MGDDAAAPAGGLSDVAEDTAAEPIEPADEADASDTEASDDATVDDEDAADEEATNEDEDGDAPVATKRSMSPVRLALILGLVAVLALSGLVGWLGYRAHQAQVAKDQRGLFLQVGRQGAVNLTTIDFEHVDDDVKRILDSATGSFYDEFQQRAQPFAEVVKQVKSKSVGTVTEAGLEVTDAQQESKIPTDAEVLVAVTVNTSVAGQPEQAPRAWRMRIRVEQVDDGAKVSNVEFVP